MNLYAWWNVLYWNGADASWLTKLYASIPRMQTSAGVAIEERNSTSYSITSKSRISLAVHDTHNSCSIVVKLWTVHGSIIPVLYAKFQNDWAT